MKKILCLFLLLFSIISSYEQTLTSVSPTSAVKGQLLNVSISGSNTYFTQATNTTVWFEQGSSTIMLPNNVLTVNDNTLSATLQVNPLQPTGLYNLRLNNSVVGNLSLLNSFTVNNNSAQLISVSPGSTNQGSVLNVTISGQNTHFNQGTGTVCWFQQGTSTIIYPTTQNATSATSLTANYSIPSNAIPGYYHTYTNNNTDGMLMLGSSFMVNYPVSYNIQATANPTNGGFITGGGSYYNNQTCTLTAYSATGYSFLNWTENGNIVSSSSSYSFTVNWSRNFTANFIPNIYTVYTSVLPAASGVASGGGSYYYNQQLSLHATANSGWNFNKWTENGSTVSTDSIYVFYINSNRSLIANFTLGNAVTEINDDNFIFIYPNPATNYFNVDFKNGFNENIDIQIYDVIGKMVLNQSVASKNPMRINVENLKNGVYYVKVIQHNDKFIIKKLLINN